MRTIARRTRNPAVLAALLAAAVGTLQAQQPLEHPYSDAPAHLAGDVDGDGRVDLVSVANGLRVRHGQGDGTFGPFTLTQAPGSKLPAVLGDVDGDGRDDVVFRRSLPGEPTTVGVALSAGDWRFAPPILLPLSGSNDLVTAVALVDLDGDGDLDLLVGRAGEPRLLGQLGDGEGGFTPGADLVGVKGTQQVTTGDVNGDGRLDLVLRGQLGIGGQSIVGVLFGDGSGGWSAPVTVPGPLFVKSVLAADLDGDGRDELVLADKLMGGAPQLVGWAPHGGFDAPVPVLPLDAGDVLEAMSAADLDEDGRTDLVLVDDEAVVSVLRQQADGTLADPVLNAGWLTVRGVLPADVDQDGALDLLAFGDGAVTHLRGSGSGAFGPSIGLPDAPRDVAAADLDGDGREELVSLGWSGGPLLVHAADALGGWGAPLAVDAGPDGRRVAAGRFTADGRPDLLVVRGGAGTSALVLLPGGHGGAFGSPEVMPLAFHAFDGWTADVDDDGLLDVLVGDAAGQTVHVLRNVGGAFAETDVIGPFQSLRGVAGADMTGDGLTDVVVASADGNGRISVYPGAGDGTLLSPVVTEMDVAAWPENLALGDVDRDGAVDAVFYAGLLTTAVLPGLGDGGFEAPVWQQGPPSAEIVLVDLDRDGLLDLVSATSFTPSFAIGAVSVRHGTGTAAFGPAQGVPAPAGAERLAVADVDGDGAPDVVLACTLPQLVVLRNATGPWQELGHSLAGAHGFSRLAGTGTLEPGSAVGLVVTHGPAAAATSLVLGADVAFAPFQGGVLVPSPDVVVGGLVTDAGGGLALSGHWPPGMAPGTALVMQAWFVDGTGSAATTGLRGTTP